MTNSLSVSSARLLVVTGVAIASVLAFALPAFAQAATYAYVNQQGNVATFVAATPWIALATAPNMATHSGVILVSN